LEPGVNEEILSDIEAIRKDEKLFGEKNFISRTQAIEDIEFHIINRLHSIKENNGSSQQTDEFILYAEKLKRRLEAVDTKMFERLRTEISHGKYRGDSLMKLIDEYLDHGLNRFLQQGLAGYDHLDIFLNGLLTHRDLPVETRRREPEMVYYQKTPARIIFELVKNSPFRPDDVFYDLGSGTGQVTMLVNLLSSVESKGVEFEPAFFSYAKARASELNLNQVDFINADARYADYSSGNIFFMYTPFEGEILHVVLRRLQTEAGKRKIKIFSYGPCTLVVASQHWLRRVYGLQNDAAGLAGFTSPD
jgi:SAM-dependent methyltransferase